MAQHYKGLENAISKLFENYERSLEKAVEDASKQAVKDIYIYANETCLEEYYDSYDPTSYDRTYNLRRCIVPYSEISRKKDRVEVRAGVQYDASKLEDTYYGSEKYRPVNGWWVISNYLKGVHPATDGSPIKGEAFYYENIDPVSPTQKMEKYLNDYVETFYGNVLLGFFKQIR